MKLGINKQWLCLLVVLVVTLSYRVDAKETVRIVSLEWPPYAGAKLPGQGTSLKMIRQIFESAGLKVQVTFAPWNRALFLFNSGRYDAIAPEYFNEERAKTCLFSDSFDVSPLGFVVLKPNIIRWDRLEELAEFEIGTVNGYANSQAFDELVAREVLTVEVANDDSTNILKVAWGRIPMAVIDRNVLAFLLDNHFRLRSAAAQVRFNEQILAEQKLYICFQRSERGAWLRTLFNQERTKLFK